ncbi:hypothetical protein [Kitasatospora aureofaciens]|uniref:hypothetical protein n=1 Tax=Kitasatospora aureofaciens TaxID=1894 RepID=UPI001C478EFA|nr:hypothetical protein [Kitasatospora aureofaciens]MBV6700448.1 hypothetical protein [Kitasatospora aureofaciens]
MSGANGLVRLYPAAFRERWGADLADEMRAAGWKAWPGLLAGIADMWLHPTVWPADSRTQRRERAAVLALAVALATGYVGNLATEQGARFTTAPGGQWTGPATTALLLLGLALVAPRPRLDGAALRALFGTAVRRLAAPVAAGAGLVALAHSAAGAAIGASDWRYAALACWWAALAVAAVQACRTVADAGRAMVAPRPGRLRAGLASLAAAGVLAGGTLLATWPDGHPAAALAGGAGLVLLTWPASAALKDLKETQNSRSIS